MTEKRSAASSQMLRHVRRAREALERIEREGTNGVGVLANPAVQTASLRIAAEEIRRALAVFERKWK